MYENGGKYCGFVLNNERNGEGTFYYKDGGYYEGHWKKNAMNGFGRLYYDNGSLAYEGQWYEDEFHGRGKVFNDSAADLIGPFDYKTFSDYEQYWTLYDGNCILIKVTFPTITSRGMESCYFLTTSSILGNFATICLMGRVIITLLIG